MDRRARFFWVAAVVCAALLWPCPPEFRWVGVVLICAYVFLGALSLLENLSRKRRT